MDEEHEQADGGGLWDEAWSRPATPPEPPVRPHRQWEPGTRSASAGAERTCQRQAERRVVASRGRDANLTFKAPERYCRPSEPEYDEVPPKGTQRPQRGRASRPGAAGSRARAGVRTSALRGIVVGYRRERGVRARVVTLVAILLIVAAAVFAWWLLTHPDSLASAHVARTTAAVTSTSTKNSDLPQDRPTS
jgi:hypothetical protein